MFKHSLILSLSILLIPLSYCMAPNPQQAAIDQQLIEAAKKGDIPTMQDLITNQGANVNVIDPTDPSTIHTPVMYTIENGHTEAAKFLIDNYQADFKGPGFPNARAHYTLTTAIAKQCPAIVKLLIDKGIDVNCTMYSSPNTPLTYAQAQNHPRLSMTLLQPSCKKNKACTVILELLLELGANPDQRDTLISHIDPLAAAISSGCSLQIECLLAYNASINPAWHSCEALIKAQKNQAQLNKAVADNNLQAVIHCLRNGIYCNKTARAFVNSKLFECVRADDAATLVDLIKCGFGLYARDAQGNTPLHVAIEAKSNKVASLLIYLLHRTQLHSIGKYLLKKNTAEQTPMDLALQHNQSIIGALCGFKLPDNAGWCTIS